MSHRGKAWQTSASASITSVYLALLSCSPQAATTNSAAASTGQLDNTTWAAACHIDPGSTSNKSYSTRTFSVVHGTFDFTDPVFSDAACTLATMRLHASGAFVDEGPSPANAKIYNYQFQFATITVTPSTATVASGLNSRAFCGATIWQAGAALEVTGKPCQGLPTNTYYGSYQVVNGKLFFEAESTTKPGTSAAARNPVLEKTWFYTKS